VEKLKNSLIQKAINEHGNDIYPAGNKTSLHECFTVEDDECLLWFNKKGSDTTKVVREKITTADN